MTAAMGADYGARARVGVATPQANPTVEPELRALLPADIGVYATRLVHPAPRVEERLAWYIRHMPEAVRSFGTMNVRAFGFGCTGSSYVAGRALEDELADAAATAVKLPVITAAQAIRRALAALGVRRIALVSPYPEGLAEAGYRYWQDAGIEVVAKRRVDLELTDTHRIYELTSDDALQALRAIDAGGAEALVARAPECRRSARCARCAASATCRCCRRTCASRGHCCARSRRSSRRNRPQGCSATGHDPRVTIPGPGGPRRRVATPCVPQAPDAGVFTMQVWQWLITGLVAGFAAGAFALFALLRGGMRTATASAGAAGGPGGGTQVTTSETLLERLERLSESEDRKSVV